MRPASVKLFNLLFMFLLLGFGTNIASANEAHDAVIAGDISKLRALLAGSPKLLNSRNDAKEGLLHLAISHQRIEIFRFLISFGDIELGLRDNSGQYALHRAAILGNLEIMRTLLTANNHHRLSIVDNVKSAIGCSRPFCELDAQDYSRRTPLHLAILHGHTQIALDLLNGAPLDIGPDKDGLTPLHLATSTGQDCVVATLLSKYKKKYSIYCKSAADYERTSKSITERSPLHLAVQNGHAAVTSRLLYSEFDVNCVDENLDTPLHIAIKLDRIDLFNVILAHKYCNLDQKNKDGLDPIALAIRMDRSQLLGNLLGDRRLVPKLDATYRTELLHMALQRRSYGVVCKLIHPSCPSLPAIADVNRPFSDGTTPLELSIRLLDSGLIDVLLSSRGLVISDKDILLALKIGRPDIYDKFKTAKLKKWEEFISETVREELTHRHIYVSNTLDSIEGEKADCCPICYLNATFLKMQGQELFYCRNKTKSHPICAGCFFKCEARGISACPSCKEEYTKAKRES